MEMKKKGIAVSHQNLTAHNPIFTDGFVMGQNERLLKQYQDAEKFFKDTSTRMLKRSQRLLDCILNQYTMTDSRMTQNLRYKLFSSSKSKNREAG